MENVRLLRAHLRGSGPNRNRDSRGQQERHLNAQRTLFFRRCSLGRLYFWGTLECGHFVANVRASLCVIESRLGFLANSLDATLQQIANLPLTSGSSA